MSAAMAVNESIREWESEGMELGERERSANSLLWDIGDWWNRGARYGDRVQIVSAESWTGPTHGTCRVAGSVAERWPVLLRNNTLGYEHHRLTAPLPDDVAIPLLDWCAETTPPRSTQDLKTRLKQIARDAKEAALGARQLEDLTEGSVRFGIIYADPPWRFEPWSRETGMDRAADNHYPTLTLDDIRDMKVPAADDAVLFLWATVPMLPEALTVMAAWEFTYRSHFIWHKDRAGTGYWNRNQHELLLVGTRGAIPAPAPGDQYASVISAPLAEHSRKPEAFAEMIEELFPSLPGVELFARGARVGWHVWGNEAVEIAA